MLLSSVASPLIAFRFRFGSCRSDSVPFRCRSLRRFSFPSRSCSMPIISIRFRCCAFRRLSIRFRCGAVRFFSIRFRCKSAQFGAFPLRCDVLRCCSVSSPCHAVPLRLSSRAAEAVFSALSACYFVYYDHIACVAGCYHKL